MCLYINMANSNQLSHRAVQILREERGALLECCKAAPALTGKRSGARSMDNLEEKESTGKRVPTSVTDLRAARESRANEVGCLLVKLLNVGIFGLGRGSAEGSKSSNPLMAD